MKREKDKDTHVIISEVSRKKLKDKKLLISSLAANFAVSAVFSLLYSPMARGGFMTLETLPEAASIFVMLLLVFFLLYSYEKYVTKTLAELKSYLILIVSAFIVLTASIFLQRHVSEFFIPLVFLFLTCAALLNEKSAMYTLFLVSFALLFIILNGGAALIDDDGYSIVKTREVYGVLFNTLCGAVMIFTYKRNYKRINIVLLNTVFGIFITGFAVVYGAITGEFDPLNSLWTTVSVVSSTAAFMLLLPIFERVFNVATDVRLSEYLLLKNPVLKELKEKAPGTYNHSLMVGTLAESCAEAINENPLLAKAAAYYHDIGKIKAPEFFIENQFDGYNPHDELLPEVSAGKIRAHTSYGAQILREHGFPDEIIRAAEEHHGTSPIVFFFNKAKKMTEGGLDAYDYTYENNKPSGKISAIIMICDAVESAVRAHSGEDIDALVPSLIKDKMDLGQFSECDLSMKDFAVIERTLIETMGQIYHARIKYKKE